MSLRHAFIISTGLLVAAGSAGAQGLDDIRRETFRQRDQNRDKQLTQDEYGGHPGNFAALDRNGDGRLSEDEFVFRRGRSGQAAVLPQQETQAPAEVATSAFRGLDRDRNGYLTRSEWPGSAQAFEALDVNRDGRVTEAEHTPAVRTDDWLALFQARDRNRDGRLTSDEWSGEQVRFEVADVNNDRAVSVYEYMYRQQAGDTRSTEFAALDRNRDGYLSRGEWNSDRAAFDRIDRDNDGRVSAREFANPLSADDPRGRFQALDRNRDASLSRGEWRDEERAFDLVDANDDNRVSFAEYTATPSRDSADFRYYEVDRNRDGVLSRSEWSGQRVAFHVADRNGDGVVTLREYRNLPAADEREARFDDLDRDNNNVLLRNEWPGDSTVAFADADRNRDGVVTRWEWLNPPPAAVADARFEEMDHNEDGVISRWEWHGSAGDFAALDVNDDQVVTLREFGAQVPTSNRESRFATLDRNRDGYLSRQEWPGDSESFAMLDSFRDGLVSRYEFMNTRQLEQRFGWLDRNDDGVLTRSEWPSSSTDFNQLDRNRDGRVSRDEFLL